MDQIETLRFAADEFARRLRDVPASALDAPSTCEAWSVGELVGHVVGGNRMAVALVGGASAEEALTVISGTALGDDALQTFVASASAQADAFSTADMGAVVHHPAFDMPTGQLLGFRITDLVVHAWDLARSTGGDEVLDEGLLSTVWSAVEPMVPIMGTVGVFGEGGSGAVDESAALQLRVLDACGRRP